MWNYPPNMDSFARSNGPTRGRARWALLSVVAALVTVAFGACSLPRGGTQQQICTGDAQCDDGVPCTIDRCSSEGFCEHEVDPAPVVAQVPGDCLAAECQGAILVQVAVDDPPTAARSTNR